MISLDVMEVTILLTIYLAKYVFQISKFVSLNVFSIITRTNASETVIKHILWKCECKFDSKKFNSNQTWNNDKCRF